MAEPVEIRKSGSQGTVKIAKDKHEEYLFDLRAYNGGTDNRFHRNLDIVYWLRDFSPM
jgi:hypothetical protein